MTENELERLRGELERRRFETERDSLNASLQKRDAIMLELAEAARAFADELGLPDDPGPLERRLRDAIGAALGGVIR